ncbi:Hypothetical protein CAP_7949 [Chondromyces apiculatus DSM 436]|uniref:Uncharacterized protein n=2 Tax=Chondromyces apiculatus TaxID=51 RepID=A0A017SYF3_9BACT|nr:Hypothetical protein CAP_7949 [Chondromyces apiculatus DSM 436]
MQGGGPPPGGFGAQPGAFGGPPPGGFGGPAQVPVGTPVGSGKSSPLKVIGIAVGAVLAVVLLGVVYFFASRPTLRIVNTTGTDGITVSVDGEPLAPSLKNAAKENESLVKVLTLSSGAHKIEAKDATGKVLETFNLDFESGLGSNYLYAPARPKGVCFFVQTDEYKTNATAADTVTDRFKALEQDRTIWKMPASIDYWFQDSPESVTIKTKKSSSGNVIKRSLRQAACDDPEFSN